MLLYRSFSPLESCCACGRLDRGSHLAAGALRAAWLLRGSPAAILPPLQSSGFAYISVGSRRWLGSGGSGAGGACPAPSPSSGVPARLSSWLHSLMLRVSSKVPVVTGWPGWSAVEEVCTCKGPLLIFLLPCSGAFCSSASGCPRTRVLALPKSSGSCACCMSFAPHWQFRHV